jgi:hypothetical protein
MTERLTVVPQHGAEDFKNRYRGSVNGTLGYQYPLNDPVPDIAYEYS